MPKWKRRARCGREDHPAPYPRLQRRSQHSDSCRLHLTLLRADFRLCSLPKPSDVAAMIPDDEQPDGAADDEQRRESAVKKENHRGEEYRCDNRAETCVPSRSQSDDE